MNTNHTQVIRNPQAHLPTGQSPRERGRQKLSQILRHLYEWHTTVEPLAREVLGTTETGYLRELEKKGFVKSFPAPTLTCGRAFMLSADGVNAAAASLGKELPYSVHPASVSHSLLKHNLAVQRFANEANRLGHQITPGRFLSATKNGKIPDAMLKAKDTEALYAVELELTGKWSDELEQSLNAHLNAILRGDWSGVIYVSNSEVLLDRYAARLEAPIADWFQSSMSDGSQRWMRGASRDVSDDERARFHWKHMPNVLKGLEM